MKLKELRDVSTEAFMIVHLSTSLLRRRNYETEAHAFNLKLGLAEAALLHAEAKEHIGVLESGLEICEAVARGRYLEDRQRGCARWGSGCRYACTSQEDCENFDERDPYTAIRSLLDELEPFTEGLRSFIVAQGHLQRSRRQAIWGEGGLFGGATIVMHTQDEDGVLHPMSEEESKDALAMHDADKDRANESMALRVDQYDLNLGHIRRICHERGDLREIVTIINDGLPPTLRQPISPS
jgi:hypothetical protein